MNTAAMVSAIGLAAWSAGNVAAQYGAVDWNEYLGGADSSHYSPLKQINVSNVAKIQVAWSYSAPEGNQEGYIIAHRWSTITAYDLNAGKILWQTPYGVRRKPDRAINCAGTFRRGAGLW